MGKEHRTYNTTEYNSNIFRLNEIDMFTHVLFTWIWEEFWNLNAERSLEL